MPPVNFLILQNGLNLTDNILSAYSRIKNIKLIIKKSVYIIRTSE